MAYTFDPNRVVTDFALELFAFIEAQIVVGWRILGSGDGLSAFENTGETAGSSGTGSGGGFHVLTSGGSGANGMGNQTVGVGSSWVRIGAPLDSLNPNLEYLWTLSWQAGLALNNWRLMVSIDGTGFDTGADADVAPTAADEASLAGNQVQQAASTDFRVWVPSGGGVHQHFAVGDRSENYSFAMVNFRVSTAVGFGFWGLDTVTSFDLGTSPPGTADPDPHVHMVSHAGGAGSGIDCFDVLGRQVFYRNDINATEKIEDMTGVAGPAGGAYAFLGKGESTPPGDEGLYQVSVGVPHYGDAINYQNFVTDAQVHPITSNLPHMGGFVWARFSGASTINFIKGYQSSRIWKLTDVTAHVVDEQGTESRLRRNGSSIPWPSGIAFVL